MYWLLCVCINSCRSNVQKNLEDMITEVIKRREDEISEMISDAIHKLTKAEESAETASTDPSYSQVTPVDSLSKKAPKETALELLNAFGVSATDTKKKGSKEAVGTSKVRAAVSGETKRASSGSKHKGVPPGLSQVRPVTDAAEQSMEEKETGTSSYTAKSQKQHLLRLSSSDESGNGDDEESDNQSPLGEPQLLLQSQHQPKRTSRKSSHERKESELSVQLQSRKKQSETKMESQHTPAAAAAVASATKPATVESTRHALKRQFSSTDLASKDGSGVLDQPKRKKCVHEDVVEEEHVAEAECARTSDDSSKKGSSRKQKMVMVTRSQSTKSRKN